MGTTRNPRIRVAVKQCSSGSVVKRQWMVVRVLGFEHCDARALELGCDEGGVEGTGLRRSSATVRLCGRTYTGRNSGAAWARGGASVEAGWLGRGWHGGACCAASLRTRHLGLLYGSGDPKQRHGAQALERG